MFEGRGFEAVKRKFNGDFKLPWPMAYLFLTFGASIFSRENKPFKFLFSGSIG